VQEVPSFNQSIQSTTSRYEVVVSEVIVEEKYQSTQVKRRRCENGENLM
jgi:hypothetical protein